MSEVTAAELAADAQPEDLLTRCRRIAYPGHGDRPGGNTILTLCDELERAQKTNAALAAEVVILRAELQHYRDEGLIVKGGA